MSTELAKTQQCELSDKKDEQQIIADMQGMRHMLETWVYQFEQGGRTVTALSYAGIKEAIRRRGNFKIIERQIEETPTTYRAIIIIEDLQTNTQFMGCNEVDKKKPFAYVLALNKAERNAYAKAVPAELIATLVKLRLEAGDGIETISADPISTTTAQPKKVTATEIPKAANVETATYHDGSTITRVDYTTPQEQSTPQTTPTKPAYNSKKTIKDYTENAKRTFKDGIIWLTTSGGNYEKALREDNKDSLEYNRIEKLLTDAKDTSVKGLAINGYWYFLDSYKNDGFLRQPSKFSKPEGTP